ncbi:C2 domain-containing protein 5 [Acropora cervicornis]|uniref:C2 domain-containing protein 5 n=1 Tax=Acropora cervicornis TaxID=6130 RepID=A0AAD9QY27_ACRCE|nr:C2 domain-containing protein 5 [Acropora cervicornis]
MLRDLCDTYIIYSQSSTAVFLAALPVPPVLKVTGRRLSTEEDKRLTEIQKQILETTNKNRASFRLTDAVHLQHVPKTTPPPSPSHDASAITTGEGQDEAPKAELDLCTGPKDAYVVEVDDKKDEDVVAVLLDEPAPDAVQRKALSDEDVRTNQQFAKLFEDTIKSFWFKLRNLSPCCLSNVHFDIEIPEDDNIQLIREPHRALMLELSPMSFFFPLKRSQKLQVM